MKKLKFVNWYSFLFICILFILPLFACSEENSQDADGIYTISNADDLVAFSESVNSGKTYSGQTVNQVGDIDLSGIEFIPIGVFDSGNYFYGTYNGNGYTISNLYIVTEEGSANNGLFGMLGGTIINLNLSGYITGNCCGSFASHSINSDSKIINCHSSVIVNANRSGGIADNFGGYIYGCGYFSEELPLAIVGYNATCVSYSYANSDDILPDTFGGDEENNYKISDTDNLEDSVNSNLAAVSVLSGVKLSQLTKYGVTETASFFDSLSSYPKKTLKTYLYQIIAISILALVIIDIIVVFVVEVVRYRKDNSDKLCLLEADK